MVLTTTDLLHFL